MRKWMLLVVVVLLAGCSMGGAPPPEKPEWYTIKSPTGKCYEYINWKSVYSGYTIAGQVDPSYCK